MKDEPVTDLEFMQDPMKWPLMVLPLKRRKGGELGLMFNERPRVYTVNLYDLPNYQGVHPDSIPHLDYPDLEGLVADGWVVD